VHELLTDTTIDFNNKLVNVEIITIVINKCCRSVA